MDDDNVTATLTLLQPSSACPVVAAPSNSPILDLGAGEATDVSPRAGDVAAVSPPSSSSLAASSSSFIMLPPHLLSRLIYTNPVCALITKNACTSGTGSGTGSGCDTVEPGHNAMVVSWLTAADNDGSFIMSINVRRHTLINLRSSSLFTLSPAVEGQEGVLLALGGSSGSDTNVYTHTGKLETIGVSTTQCAPTEPPPHLTKKRPRAVDALAAVAAAPPCLAASPARLVCRLRSELTCNDGGGGVTGHALLLCDIITAFVSTLYWDSKRFAPLHVGLPRLLCFQGSRTFSAIHPLAPCDDEGEGVRGVERGGAPGGQRQSVVERDE